MRIVELILDEQDEMAGVDAVSLVEYPAIEENFVALKEQITLAEVDKEKHILMGAALVPQKPIYRKNGDEEFYIFFSKETIEKVSQLFLKNSKHKNATMEHDYQLSDMTIVESWIVEDAVHDKSRKFGMEVPVGTWMVSMKVEDDSVWNDYVKTGKVKGFSIEGYFADRYQMNEEDKLINEIKEIIMREEKSVYKALFSEQEPKKVELGLGEDIKRQKNTAAKALSKLKAAYKQFKPMSDKMVKLQPSAEDVVKEYNSVKKKYVPTKDKFDQSSNNLKNVYNDAYNEYTILSKLLNTLDRKLEELDIDPSKNKDWMAGNDVEIDLNDTMNEINREYSASKKIREKDNPFK